MVTEKVAEMVTEMVTASETTAPSTSLDRSDGPPQRWFGAVIR